MVSQNTQRKCVTTYTTTTTQFVSSTNYNYTDSFLTSATVDTNGDRIADQTISYFNYAMQVEYDFYGDGIVGDYDTIFSFNLYPNGQVSESYDSTPAGDIDGDGITDYGFTIFTYDTYGNYTSAWDGIYQSQLGIEELRRNIYTYDDNGHLIYEFFAGSSGQNTIKTYTYDNNGNLTLKTYDFQADGEVDQITEYTYDSNGNKLSEYNYFTKIRPFFTNTYTRYIYDNNGNLTSRSITADKGADGTLDSITTYTYNSNGNLTSITIDDGANGTLDSITTYTYNSNGNLTSITADKGADGTLDSITTYTYDSNGNLTSTTVDNSADDSFDSTTTYTYNSNGKLISQTVDNGADGTLDSITTYTYHNNGKLASENYSYDFDGDGIPDLIGTQTYDTFGNSSSSIEDYGLYGIIENIATFIYKVFAINYDTNNDGKTDKVVSYQYNLFTTELTAKITDENNDGVIDEKITYTYNQGQIATENIDTNVDSRIDDVYRYNYDGNGQLISKTFDQGNNGSIEENISYAYNSQGQLEVETTDNNGDGLADLITTYSYDANGTLINSTTNAVIRTQYIVGGNDKDILSGNDALDNIAGNNGNDELYGLGGNDTLDGGNGSDLLVGGFGADILTGGNGPDTFRYVALTDSLLSSYDKITDLAINTDTIDGINAVSKKNVFHAGAVNSLSVNDIQAVLTNSKFVVNCAATFTLGTGKNQQTFIALNDNTAGFSAATDAIMEITGFTGNLQNLAII